MTFDLSKHPLAQLRREDLDLVTELVLQSGSLKGLAASYGVSYPTIRLRVDKLLTRLRAVLDDRPADPLREALAEMVARGEVSARGARRIQEVANESRRREVHDVVE